MKYAFACLEGILISSISSFLFVKENVLIFCLVLYFDFVNQMFSMRIRYADQFVKYFGKYGEITDSVIMKDRNTGQPRGFGFVTYADASVVDRVIEETHIINGKQVGILIFIK